MVYSLKRKMKILKHVRLGVSSVEEVSKIRKIPKKTIVSLAGRNLKNMVWDLWRMISRARNQPFWRKGRCSVCLIYGIQEPEGFIKCTLLWVEICLSVKFKKFIGNTT